MESLLKTDYQMHRDEDIQYILGMPLKKKIPPSETAQDNGYLTTFTQYYAKHMKV